MRDTKALLKDARRQFPPPDDVMGSLVRRRQKRTRNRRIKAATLALVVTAGAFGGLALTLRETGQPSPPAQSPPVGGSPQPSPSQVKPVRPSLEAHYASPIGFLRVVLDITGAHPNETFQIYQHRWSPRDRWVLVGSVQADGSGTASVTLRPTTYGDHTYEDYWYRARGDDGTVVRGKL